MKNRRIIPRYVGVDSVLRKIIQEQMEQECERGFYNLCRFDLCQQMYAMGFDIDNQILDEWG